MNFFSLTCVLFLVFFLGIWGFENSEDIKWYKKVGKRSGYFPQMNFGSFKLILNIVLQNTSFPCSQQSINWYCSAWCTPIRILIQGLQSSCLFWQEGRGREAKKTPPSLHYYFLLFQVGCTAMLFHRVLFSHKNLKRVVREPDCSELPWCQPDSIKRINVLPTSLDTQ